MPICRVDGDTVIPMEAVQHALHLPRRYAGHSLPGRGCVMCLARSHLVEGLEVHRAAGGTIMLCCNYHATSPCVWGIDRQGFNDTQGNITVNASLHVMEPMGRYLAGCGYSFGCGLVLNKEAKWWRVPHQRHFLLLAAVECAGGVSVQDVLLEDGEVLIGR